MKIKILLPLICCLLVLFVTVRPLWADGESNPRPASLPPGYVLAPPLHEFTGFRPDTSSPPGYSPQQVRHAYGIDQLNTTGQGQMIAIVDNYGSPTIQADLDTFCAAFKLPSTKVMIYYPQGQPPANNNWAVETSLDVEWAHAIAPGATLALVVANTDLYAAVDYAVGLGAKQVSMSWAGAEFPGEETIDSHFNVPGVSFFAASGDWGAGVNYPACSPYVVGVGGTTLNLDSTGNILSESGWSDSGGGASAYEPVPSFQAGWWNGPGRGVPDVAYDADPATGVPVYLTGSGWGQWGGTSISTPQWAALCALANSLRTQSIVSAPAALYSLANGNYAGDYHDIITGSNGAYSALSGYDLVTGLGSPQATSLVVALAGGNASQAAAPVFFPSAGMYANAQTVTIVSATPGRSVRYTTDGSTPTESAGTLYAGPLAVSANVTLQAIAYGPGCTDSPVTGGRYTFLAQTAAPTFSPSAGSYALAQAVSLATATAGATIRYTVDGSTPTESNGAVYSGPVCICSPSTLQAVAYKSGLIDSSVTSGTYAISPWKVLSSFVSSSNGIYPEAALVQGSDGNFYGTTVNGGSGNQGTVFKITSGGNLTTLVSFTGTNGSQPSAALIQGSDGNFYGTTVYVSGSSGNYGTVFKMTPAGVLTTLVSFGSADGHYPYAGLVEGSDGNFYGTTAWGGSANEGTVFKLTPKGVLTTLVSLTGANGINPYASLVQGRDGNFYGTTELGGAGGDGTVFKITPAGVLTPLVSFNGANGMNPYSALVQGSDGNFYGTTLLGGANDEGTVFKMTPTGVLATLDSFNGAEGANPYAGLIQGRDGTFYGTTESGGYGDDGTVFNVTSSGSFNTVASFDGVDGLTPYAGLVQGSDGNLYGSAAYGGDFDYGVIFQLTPPPQVASPTFSAAPGTYAGAQVVTINTTTAGARIVYTTDGTTPTETNGLSYTAPVGIGATTTLQALACEMGYVDSAAVGGLYTIDVSSQVAAPTFSPAAGTYASAQKVKISTATSGASIRYTTDGSTPTESSGSLYSGSIKIGKTATLKAIAYKSGMADSSVSSGLYTIGTAPQPVAAPAFSPAAGTYTSAQTVTITSSTSGASIRYTTDGSTPSETAGTLYSSPVSIGATATLKAIAYKSGMTDSSVASGLYTIGAAPQLVAAPSFSPAAGTYTSAQAVTITSSTSGASIRYTTDGSTPSETAGTLYSSPVSISATATLKAIAYKSGMTDSSVTSGLYTINAVTRSLTGSSGNGFHSLALTSAQTGTFTATFDATPSVSPENAVVGLSKGAATAYSSLSCIARFNPSGDIDAYNGTAYGTSTIPYSAGVTYHFRMVVNVSAGTYSVYVTPAGGSELTVGLDYAFRKAATSLDTWNLEVDATPAGCSLTANNLAP